MQWWWWFDVWTMIIDSMIDVCGSQLRRWRCPWPVGVGPTHQGASVKHCHFVAVGQARVFVVVLFLVDVIDQRMSECVRRRSAVR